MELSESFLYNIAANEEYQGEYIARILPLLKELIGNTLVMLDWLEGSCRSDSRADVIVDTPVVTNLVIKLPCAYIAKVQVGAGIGLRSG